MRQHVPLPRAQQTDHLAHGIGMQAHLLDTLAPPGIVLIPAESGDPVLERVEVLAEDGVSAGVS